MMMMPTKRAAVVAMLGLQMMMTLPAIRGDPGVHTCCTKCCAPQSGGPPFPPDICNEELNTCWDMARTLAYYVCDNGEWCGRPGGIRDPSLPYYNWCCMYEPGENIPDWTGTPARDKCNNPTAHPPTCFNVVNNFHHFFNEICEDNQGEKDYTDQYPTFGILGHLQGEPCGCDGFCGGEPHFKVRACFCVVMWMLRKHMPYCRLHILFPYLSVGLCVYRLGRVTGMTTMVSGDRIGARSIVGGGAYADSEDGPLGYYS